MADQAQQWVDLDGPLKGVENALSKFKAPPVPDDEWGNKLNQLNRTVEGMREQLNGRIEMEDLTREQAALREDV